MSGEVGKQIVNISISRRFYVSPTDKLKEENLKKYGHLKSHCIIIEMDYNGQSCTAIGNLDHSLNQDCATITIYLEGVSDGKTKKIHP